MSGKYMLILSIENKTWMLISVPPFGQHISKVGPKVFSRKNGLDGYKSDNHVNHF